MVDAVAEAAASAVDIYGHSYGGLCVFGGARLTSSIRRVVLYEGWPPVNLEAWGVPSEVVERLGALVAEGNREVALELFMREVLMMHEDDIEVIRAQPSWPARVAAVHTVPRELRAISEVPFDSKQAALITAPTLLLTGSDSPDPAAAEADVVAGAMPDARVEVLEGQQHVADVLAPEVFAEHMVAFLARPTG